MTIKQNVVNVFVASPGDVQEERELLEGVVREINTAWSANLGIRLELIKWETNVRPGVGHSPQEVINRQIDNNYDVFIGILWNRFGTPTDHYDSGTEEEFAIALQRHNNNAKCVSIMIYIKEAPIVSSMIDLDQLSKVRKFKSFISGNGVLYRTYSSIDEFEALLRLHLSKELQDHKSRSDGSPQVTEALTQQPQIQIMQQADEGFLDLVEEGTAQFARLESAAKNMTDAIELLAERTNKRALEIEQAQVGDGQINLKLAQKAANGFADDMNDFVSRMTAEIPLFSASYKKGIDAFGRAATLLPQFTIDDATRAMLHDNIASVSGLSKSIEDMCAGVSDFREMIVKTPPVTMYFNKAKRLAIEAIDQLLSEAKSFISLNSELMNLMQHVIDNDGQQSL